ncbi:hypothetical protein [Paludibacterium denitrificans]|uniref:Uncharacterized protein n=1 Tax=Paludibacterium denitrificans TaxID=2675226 RepID=A0A844GDI5_9NEIS|nr:hypothetical protein [Paludibacterium denitrificans]MTD33719.1 hypothetical protein [Paludibacterium denitrificans]
MSQDDFEVNGDNSEKLRITFALDGGNQKDGERKNSMWCGEVNCTGG